MIKLELFLEKCKRYPSPDNCQPFYFNILNQNEFEIRHDSSKSAHRLNLGNVPIFLSLGGLLETISIVAKNYQLKSEETLFVSDSNSFQQTAWARVRLQQDSTALPDPLTMAIASRYTDRRQYQNQVVKPEVVLKLKKEAAEKKRIQFFYHDKMSLSLRTEILQIEEEIWRDGQIARDIFHWIRFSREDAEATRDGLSWPTLALKAFQKPSLQLFKRFPKFYKIATYLGLTKGQRQYLKTQLDRSGGFGWIAVRDDEPATLIEAGRVYYRMWLTLTNEGYCFQPISAAVLTSFSYQFKSLPSDWRPRLHSMRATFISQFQQESEMDPEWIPVWAFRTGQPESSETIEVTLRKNINDMVQK